jgi:hypothetical protein
MMDLSTGLRARLITAFGTVLYLDVASGELRHGDVESSPANVFFMAERGATDTYRRGFLLYNSGTTSELIVCHADSSRAVSRTDGYAERISPTLLELVPLERGLIALTAHGLFLSASPDGCVRLSVPWCSTWELFLASEDWCSDARAAGDGKAAYAPSINWKGVASYLVHPMLRVRVNTKPKAKKILVYGYTKWSHGRVYYDLCKHLHRRGYIVDILDWQVNHADYIAKIVPYYDLFMTALDGVQGLARYGIPNHKIIGVSHHEFDIRMLIERKGMEVFNELANYGVVSEYVYCASLMRGVQRVPKVAPLGVNYSEFHAERSERLSAVGYASSMAVETYGVEWKRGKLAEAAVRDAGLEFKVAGWTGGQISSLDMPDFYRTVDAVVVSSLSEAAQLPVMEAAAAGRLVIGTPVGHFPQKAYQGGGILAPIEADKFQSFTAATLRYYRENRAAYVDKCRTIQEAAQKFDWQHSIGAWVELIEEAAGDDASSKETRQRDSSSSLACSQESAVAFKAGSGRSAKEQGSPTGRPNVKKAVICDLGWLSGYICYENYYLTMLLQDTYGYEIIDSKTTEFHASDVIAKLNRYDALVISYQGWVDIPMHQISAYKIFRVDDLVSYDAEFDKYLRRMIDDSDMIISPYAYAFGDYFKHKKVVWLPFSSPIESYTEIAFNTDPDPKVLVSGSIAWDRPLRRYAAGVKNAKVDVLAHPGYGGRYDEQSNEIVGERYLREINKYLCCFSDAHKYRYLHLKNFEIASVGSLLLADKLIEPELNKLGFVEKETCVFADERSFLERLEWICDGANREHVDRIRRAGMNLVKHKHLTSHRAKQLNDIIDAAIADRTRAIKAGQEPAPKSREAARIGGN